MTDTKELRRLAEAATPGPWFVGSKTNSHWKRAVGFGDKPAMNSVAFCGHSEAQAHKDAAYIAGANPVSVIELLDTIDRLTAERDALAKDAERYRWLRDINNSDAAAKIIPRFIGCDVDTIVDAAIAKEKTT